MFQMTSNIKFPQISALTFFISLLPEEVRSQLYNEPGIQNKVLESELQSIQVERAMTENLLKSRIQILEKQLKTLGENYQAETSLRRENDLGQKLQKAEDWITKLEGKCNLEKNKV